MTTIIRTAIIDAPSAVTFSESYGVVLAGGKSSRMGSDKAALCLDGELLLLRAQRLLREAGCQHTLLSGAARHGWTGDAVSDLLPDTGPVGGIVSTLMRIADTTQTTVSVLFIPVDAPCLSPKFLRSMLEQARLAPSTSDGCAITGAPLPVVLNMTSSVIARCAEMQPELAAGHSLSIRRFLQPLALHTLDVPDVIKPQFMNVNTPSEWEALQKDICREPENRA